MDDELYHYGIKGMKWGIRRTDAQLGHVKKQKKNSRQSSVTKKAGNNESSEQTLKRAARKMANGVSKGKEFVSNHKGLLASTLLAAGLSAAGLSYLYAPVKVASTGILSDIENDLFRNYGELTKLTGELKEDTYFKVLDKQVRSSNNPFTMATVGIVDIFNSEND